MKTNHYLLVPLVLIVSVLECNAQIKISKLQEHVLVLAADSLEGRGLGTEGSLKAIDYIESQFKEIGIKPLLENGYRYNFSFAYGMVRQNATNLVAIIEGNDPILKHEYILIGAHHDHLGFKYEGSNKIIWNGADDNASGVSTVIEVARILKDHQSSLKRSIIVTTFDAEEIGLIGSKRFLYDSIVEVSNIKFMFSIDMVGQYTENNGLKTSGISMVNGAKEMCNEIQKEMDIILTKVNNNKSSRTDCHSFLEYGIPACHFDTGISNTYHEPNDTEEKIDYLGMEKIANFLFQYCIKLSQAETITPNIHLKNKTLKRPKFVLNSEIGLGRSYFNYKNEKFNSNQMLNINMGISKRIKLNKFIILKPELLYSINGGSDSLGSIIRHSLVSPINFNIYTVSPVYVTIGGYYARCFYGKSKSSNKLDFHQDYNPNEFGINTGFSLRIYNSLRMEYRASYGLTNIFKNNDKQAFFRGNTITVSWEL